MMTVAALMIQQTSAEARAAGGLDSFALFFMLLSMGAVTALAIWCFWRILRGQQHFDPDGTGPAHAPVAGEVERESRHPAE